MTYTNIIICFIAFLFILLLFLTCDNAIYNDDVNANVNDSINNNNESTEKYVRDDGYFVIKHHAEDGITRWNLIDIPKNSNLAQIKSIMNNYYYQCMIISDPIDSTRHLDGIYKYKILNGKFQKENPEYVPRNSKEYEIVEELRKFYSCKYEMIHMDGPDSMCKNEKEKIRKKYGTITAPRHDIFIKTSH
jgi:hypothetical protein